MSKPAPVGNGRKTTGFADPGSRTKYLLERFGIAPILQAMRSEKYLAKNFSSYDGMLIMGIANALIGNGAAGEKLLDRMFGKMPNKKINLTVSVDATPEQLSERALVMLAQLGG